MYFKISVNSKTGKKIAEIFDRADQVMKRRISFMKNVGAESGYSSGRYIEGLSSVKFNGEVDRKEWKFYNKKENLYEPKVKSKFKKEFDSIGCVYRHEIDKVIGNKDFIFHSCGLIHTKKWLLINITEGPNRKLNSDCIEIISSEYKKLSEFNIAN